MRVVTSPKDFGEACISASSEAKSAFGDGSIYLEKYLSRPRHVEFQIVADNKADSAVKPDKEREKRIGHEGYYTLNRIFRISPSSTI